MSVHTLLLHSVQGSSEVAIEAVDRRQDQCPWFVNPLVRHWHPAVALGGLRASDGGPRVVEFAGWRPDPPTGKCEPRLQSACKSPLREVAAVAARAAARRLRSRSGGPRAAVDGRWPEPPAGWGSDSSQGVLGCKATLREVAASAAARRLRSKSGGPRGAADGWARATSRMRKRCEPRSARLQSGAARSGGVSGSSEAS